MYVACVKMKAGSEPAFFFGADEMTVKSKLIAYIETSTGQRINGCEGFFPENLGLEIVEMGTAIECE